MNRFLPPAYVAWRAGTTNMAVVPIPARRAGNRFLGSFTGLKIRALYLQGSKGEGGTAHTHRRKSWDL
jgi:hypothetical protein